LRHSSRTHGVNVAWLHEVFQNPDYRLYYQPTLGQCSDMFIKQFTIAVAWRHACDLIGIIIGDVGGRSRGGGNALQTWVDRVRGSQDPGFSKSGGDKKRATCPVRSSHDRPNPSTSTAGHCTTAADAAPAVAMQCSWGSLPVPALCAPAHFPPLLQRLPPARALVLTMASPAPASTGASPSAANPAVAETPREGRGREQGRGGRYRSESRTRRESAERRGSRGRSIERRERSYDPRSNSLETNRERSRSAFRDKNTGSLLPNRLYTLSKLLVKVCRHTATEASALRRPTSAGFPRRRPF